MRRKNALSTKEYDVQDTIHDILFHIARAAARLTRRERFSFTDTTKTNGIGENEKVTDIDRKIEAYVRGCWEEAFPGIPLIGEESYKQGDPPLKARDYGTCDPIDGTEAFIRKQSHGISSMLAYVRGKDVIAACVADMAAQEAYSFDASRGMVMRFSPHTFEEGNGLMNFLKIDLDRTLASQHLIIGRHPDEYSPVAKKLLARKGLFKDIEIDKGSIGTRAARVWKGEVGAILLKPTQTTPWDDTPVIGFFRALGFIFIKIAPDGKVSRFDPPLVTRPQKVKYETLVIHASRLDEARTWFRKELA